MIEVKTNYRPITDRADEAEELQKIEMELEPLERAITFLAQTTE